MVIIGRVRLQINLYLQVIENNRFFTLNILQVHRIQEMLFFLQAFKISKWDNTNNSTQQPRPRWERNILVLMKGVDTEKRILEGAGVRGRG